MSHVGAARAGEKPMSNREPFAGADIVFRLQNSNFEHVSNLCHNLINVTSSIRRNLRDLNQKDIDLLKPLSEAIVVSFNPEKASAEFAAEVTQKVRDKYR